MAKKKLNKNLVGMVTVTGMVLAIAVVAVAVYNAANKDPEFYAQKAKQLEEKGDLKRAWQMYLQAYDVNKEVKYSVEAARLLYNTGEIAASLEVLRQANAKNPTDVPVLEALLNRLWELDLFAGNMSVWTQMRDNSEKLLELQPENTFALVCRSTAYGHLAGQDPKNEKIAEEALEKARKLQPDDKYVALVTARDKLRDAAELAMNKSLGTGPADADAQIKSLKEQAVETLEAAIKRTPDSLLYGLLGQSLADLGRNEECRKVLQEAVEKLPEDPDARVAIARFDLAEALKAREAQDYDRAQKLAAQARAEAQKAIELETVLYRGYETLAEIEFQKFDGGEDTPASRGARFEKSLAVYKKALSDTVGVASIRAALDADNRVLTVFRGFQRALEYFNRAADDAQRQTATELARGFYESAKTEYPELFLTFMLQGELALVENDQRTAVRAFERAAEKMPQQQPQFARAIHARLADLYRTRGNEGLALEQINLAIEASKRAGIPVNDGFLVNRADLLNLCGKPQDALDAVDDLLDKDPENVRLLEIKASALAKLDRNDEAAAILNKLAGKNERGVINEARFALYQSNQAEPERKKQLVDQAIGMLTSYIAANPDDGDAWRLLMTAYGGSEGGRSAEATKFLDENLSKVKDADLRRGLEGYRVVVSTSDSAERDAKLLELIGKIPDDKSRLAELVSFYSTRKKYDEALAALEDLLKIDPDNNKLKEQKMLLLIVRKQYDAAEKLVAELARANYDGVGGAILRGQLMAARGDAAGALTEFRAAEVELPTDTALKLRIAETLIKCDPPRFSEALAALDRVVEYDPRNFMANKLLYLIYEQLGRRDEGIPNLEIASQINPNDPLIRERAQLLEEERNPAKGLKRYEQILSEKPEDVEALLRGAELAQKAGQNDIAASYVERAAKLAPERAGLAALAVRLFAATGDREAGERVLKAHIDAVSGREKINGRSLLARLYENLGDLQAAQQTLLELDDQVAQLVTDPAEQKAARADVAGELVEFYNRQRAWDPMVEACRKMQTLLDPTASVERVQRVRLREIEGLFKGEKYGDAEKAVEAYNTDYPDDPRAQMAQAQMLLVRNELEPARELLNRVLQRLPDHAWSLYTRGLVNMRLKRYQEARDDLLKAKSLAPDGLDYAHRFALVDLYELTNQLPLAESELRSMVDEDPTNSRFALRLIQFYRNHDLIPKAQQFLGELMARRPDEPFWPYQLGVLMLSREQYSAAIDPLRKAVQLTQAKNADVLTTWVAALQRAGQAKEAIRVFQEVSSQGEPPAPLRATIAEAYWKEGQQEESLNQLTKGATVASQLTIGATNAVFNRATDYLEMGQVIDLIGQMADKSAAGTPARVRLQSVKANFLIRRNAPGDVDAAEKLLDEALAAAPERSQERIYAYVLQGQVYARQKRFADMVKSYEAALQIAPNSLTALNNLAYSLAEDMNRPAEALPYAKRAESLAEDNAVVLDTVGWVYFKNDDLSRAEASLRKSLLIDASLSAARLHLAAVLNAQGDKRNARVQLEDLLQRAKNTNDSEYVEKAQEALRKL